MKSVDPRLTNIMTNMLEFNPYFRTTPLNLLKSSLFDSIRDPQREERASKTIKVSYDEPGAFDYENLEPVTL